MRCLYYNKRSLKVALRTISSRRHLLKGQTEWKIFHDLFMEFQTQEPPQEIQKMPEIWLFPSRIWQAKLNNSQTKRKIISINQYSSDMNVWPEAIFVLCQKLKLVFSLYFFFFVTVNPAWLKGYFVRFFNSFINSTIFPDHFPYRALMYR